MMKHVMSLLLLLALHLSLASTPWARAAPGIAIPPCSGTNISNLYPTKEQSDVPLNARIYVSFNPSNYCQEWLESTLTLSTKEGEVKGTQTTSQAGGSNGDLYIFFTPEKALLPNTTYTTKLVMPKTQYFDGNTQTFEFTTGASEETQRTPKAQFSFAKAEFDTSNAQCILQLSVQGLQIEDGDIVFVHGSPIKEGGKASEKPLQAVPGNSLKLNPVEISFRMPAGEHCSKEKVCLELRVQERMGASTTLPQHCDVPTEYVPPPPTNTGCQSLPPGSFSWLGLLLFGLLWIQKRDKAPHRA